MNITQIHTKLEGLIKNVDTTTFVYDFLEAYGLPKASITRLQKGNLNMSKVEGEVDLKKKLYFKAVTDGDVAALCTQLEADLKHKERFVIVTDFKLLLAVDTKTGEKLDIDLVELPKHFDFFLPLAGMEKAQHHDENPADIKAAEKMAKLFDIIKKDNPDDSPEFIHGLNVFLSRLLFCFFAEDTHIFEENQFTNAIDSHTQTDGSDLNTFLDTLFLVLNTSDKQRGDLPQYLLDFPYVNGGLFEKDIPSPLFTRRSRIAVIDSGGQGWEAINPDIFGSMFQAVISADQRGNLGQHYTSVPNIMKVIEPLFLNEMYEELEKVGADQKKLEALLHRLHTVKIFDPACGSGNFLIIAYKELRQLEMKIFKAGGMMALSGIHLSQFYGIELDDFAGEIAKLALWLAEHQMNVAFYKEFGRTNPTLPLQEAGHIVPGNACRLDWEVVCPKVKGDEIYILGNPPYLGSKEQSAAQKEDMKFALKGFRSIGKLDYIAIWFYLASTYLKDANVRSAFVSTNSICQGEQIPALWPRLLLDSEISFAYQSFDWTNSAKSKAGITCIIVGLSNKGGVYDKLIYGASTVEKVDYIMPYLLKGKELIVYPRSKSLSMFPPMKSGSKPTDGGNLIISEEAATQLVEEYPIFKKIIKNYMGAEDFINGIRRRCIWLSDSDLCLISKSPYLEEKVQLVKDFRLKSTKRATKLKADTPYRFDEVKHEDTHSIIVPIVSSSRREYVPIGYLDKSTVIANTAQAIYSAEPWIFGVLSSKFNVIWMSVVGSRMRNDYRYSVKFCYNTFPFPNISTQRKNEITQSVFRILEEREKDSDKTLAQLYDPEKMPDGLREAHRLNDIIIEKCYRSTPFTSDEERLEYLFKLYEKMIAEEASAKASVSKGKKGGGK